MYGQDILCGITKVPFKIPHKISYPYIERCHFYTALKFQELLDLRAHKCFELPPPLNCYSFDNRCQTINHNNYYEDSIVIFKQNDIWECKWE